MERINQLDHALFTFLNGLHAPWLDVLMTWLTMGLLWLPLYLLMLYLVIRRFRWNALWVLLFCGRASLGVLADLLPLASGLHMHRFIGGVQVFGLILCAAGLVFLAPPVRQFLLPLFWYLAKTGVLLLVFIWVRGTLPRFRYDQLMRFAWTFLFPVALLNLLVTGAIVLALNA